jgi:hypothetical protein
MTQVSRYGHRLKVTVNGMRGCFVMQALQHPVPVTGRIVLNGVPLAE